MKALLLLKFFPLLLESLRRRRERSRGERGTVRCGFKLKPKAVPQIFAVIFAVSVLNGTVSVFLPQILIGHVLNPTCQ